MRTTYGKQRARERFWTEHAETVRLVMIGSVMVLLVSLLAQVLLT